MYTRTNKKILDKLISNDQTCFVKSMVIWENIRLVFDFMNYTERKQILGLTILIDLEKAFHSVSWKFIFETLEYLDLGKSIER